MKEDEMSEILIDRSDEALTWAIEENFFKFISLLKQYPKAEVHDDPELLWTITDIPFFLFNVQMRTRLLPEVVEPIIRSAIERGQTHGVPICWYVSQTTKPVDLGNRLVKHGFIREESEIGMAIDLSLINQGLPVSPDLKIERVEDPEILQTWCLTASSGFEMPTFVGEAFHDIFLYLGLNISSPVHHYIGYLNSKAVATSTLFLGAGVAGIYDVSILPEARRQGIGAAMTIQALQDARQMGYRVGILQASQMGHQVYKRIGFKEYCKINLYIKEPHKNMTIP
jgi:GNAT superfamily N-acetyltransferase